MDKKNAYWKNKLSKEKYEVLREGKTETPFSGKYYKFDKKGSFLCGACGVELFSSSTKFDSKSGWPSFYDIVDAKSIKLVNDYSWGMSRTEVLCANCNSHLGHLFDDGPKPTGKRYCINSCALDFSPRK